MRKMIKNVVRSILCLPFYVLEWVVYVATGVLCKVSVFALFAASWIVFNLTGLHIEWADARMAMVTGLSRTWMEYLRFVLYVPRETRLAWYTRMRAFCDDEIDIMLEEEGC